MFTRRSNGKTLAMLGILLLAVCVSAFAGLRNGSWDVNPAAFRYDMSLYFRLADEDFEDLDKYEIGAFVGDECRGLAEKLELSEGESCLYMRIRSNQSSGEALEFLLRDKASGKTVILRPTDGSEFLFKSGSRVGLPSDPFMMARFFSVSVKTEGEGTVNFTDGLYPAGTVISLTAVPAEGYAFDGWSNGAKEESLSLSLEADIELIASFSPVIYKAFFQLDGVDFAVLDVPFNSPVEAPEVPAKIGFRFSGWIGLPELMPAHDIMVTGSYEMTTYRITFKIDNEVIYTAELDYDTPITIPEAPAKEGYTFNGWGDVPSIMPSHDVEIHGSYSVNSYRLTFVLDDAPFLSEDVPFGSAVVAPDVPVREGYSFSGWGELPVVMPASDLTVSGSYSVNSYRLVFKIDGEEILAEDVEFGAPVSVPEAPAKEGYSFSGWGDVPATMPAHDVEMHSTYAVNHYTLTFRLDGVDLVSEQVAFGASIVAPEAPAKEGYSFSGWGEVPSVMPASDLVLDGSYAVNSYKVTYKIDGELAFSADVDFGARVPAFDAPLREGHSFSGWGDVPALMPARDIELNGSYMADSYNVTFRIGDEVIASETLVYGSPVVAPDAPAKEGHSFSGWGDVPSVMPARDLVFTGEYSVNRYRVTYLIEEVEFLTQEYDFGAPIVVPVAPEEEGHSFSGWGDIPATMPAFDLVFGGTYAENFYRVTFRLDGVVLFTDDLEYGSPVSVPDAPAKEGYSFNGWGDVPSTMPAYNLEYDASYTPNSYAVVFRIGDEVIYSGSLPYGAEVVSPAAPDKEGHSFAGWGIVPATMPASDLEVTGEYTVNSYSLTYRLGEEDFLVTQLTYGSQIEAPEAPAKEGCSFTGWTGLPETMPANDLVVAGVYSANSYTITFRIGDDVIYQGELPYGSEIVAPEAPAKEGHSFAGWGMVPASMPASELEVVGSYDVNVYNLTYRIDGEDFYTTQMAYGSEITAPAAPEREGHSFLGWSEAVSTMPANDLVVSGSYSVNNYIITFRIGDEVVFSGFVPYGTEVIVPDAPAKEGHSFSGWGLVPAVMPASDLEFYGSYDVNVYSLTFDIDGEVYFHTQLAYGTEISIPTDVPDKEGNSFGGWGNVPATMPANDLVVSGTYSANHYTLTFRIGNEVIFTGEQPYGSEIVVPEAPEKEGYSFTGWGDVPAVVPAANLEFVGAYEVNEYELKFSVDGVEVFSGMVAYGDHIVAPHVDAKTGYSFSGWGVVPSTMPASDLHISGTYDLNHYSVLFKVGEDVVYSAQVPYGAAIEVPAAPEKEGHSFVGWGDVPSAMPASDLVFEAVYSVNVYSVSFRIGDEVIFSGELEYGVELSAPEVADKEGHTFTGWGVVPSVMPASDLEFTGAFEVNSYSVVFMLGNEVFASVLLPYASEIVAPEAPAKEGHSFSGWGDIPAAMPASDLEFKGDYSVNSYMLVFKVDGNVVSEASVEYGAEIVVPTVADKEGHSFSGFGIVPAIMPASDLEFSGVYEVNSYSVVFMINDDIVYSAQLPYGAEIVAPEAPAAEGCSFSGWSEYPATVPAHDVLVSGSLSVNSYRLVVYLNGEVYLDELLPYGAEIVVPDPEVEEGMKFDGWQEEIPAVMPAHDVEIHGSVSEAPTVFVSGLRADEVVTVFTPAGILLFKDVKAADLKERLTPGVYVVNGKKMILK